MKDFYFNKLIKRFGVVDGPYLANLFDKYGIEDFEFTSPKKCINIQISHFNMDKFHEFKRDIEVETAIGRVPNVKIDNKYLIVDLSFVLQNKPTQDEDYFGFKRTSCRL